MDVEVIIKKDEGSTYGSSAYHNTRYVLDKLSEFGKLDDLPKGVPVLIKPCLSQPPIPGLRFGPGDDISVYNHVCTNPFSVKAAVEFFNKRGDTVYVGENSTWVGGVKGSFGLQGYEVALDGLDFEFIDLSAGTPDEQTSVASTKSFEGGLQDFLVNKIFEEIEVLVNMPKLKSHADVLLSGAIRNTWRFLEPAERRSEGYLGLSPLYNEISRINMAKCYTRLSEGMMQVHEGITRDIDQVILMEGIIAGEGDGPLFASSFPRDEWVVMGSINNPATIDTAACAYMGYTPEFLEGRAHECFSSLGDEYSEEPSPELLASFREPYFMRLGEELGLGRIGFFDVFVSQESSEGVVTVEELEDLRGGDVFEVPTFVGYGANTNLYDELPDPEFRFSVEEE